MSSTRFIGTSAALALALSSHSWAAGLGAVKIGGYEAHPTRLLVRTLGDPGNPRVQTQSAAALSAAGMTVGKRFSLVPGLMTVNIPSQGAGTSAALTDEAKAQRLLDRIQLLQDSGAFAYVEPDYVVRADVNATDSKYVDGTAWGLLNNGQDGGVAGMDVGALPAWQISTGSTNVIVAVIDTGIRYTHSDLRDQMWTNEGETGLDSQGRDKATNGVDDDGNGVIDDVHGFNAETGSGDPFDDGNHGTHVAGTIGAAANNGYPHVGVAWNVRLMGCKFLRASGGGYTADAVDCVNYAVQMGAKISNNSWGGGPFAQSLFDVVQQAGVRGHLFLAAAGNDGSNNDLIAHYPSNLPLENVISVGAIDRKGLLAAFSNYGVRTVHVAAPGVDIYSTWGESDLAYSVISGTSMATPHVSGVAALVAAAHPNADIYEIRERILSTVVGIPSTKGTTVTGGIVNAYNAIKATADGILEYSANPPAGATVLVGTQTTVQIKISDVIGVTNASVAATIDGPGIVGFPVVFSNDGVNPDQTANDAIYTGLIPAATAEGTVTVKLTAVAAGKEPLEVTYTYKAGGRPSNDGFGKAKKIGAGGQIITDSTRFSTLELGEPKHAKLPGIVGSLWYAWAPSVSGKALIETVGSDIGTYLAVYTGDALLNLREIASTSKASSGKNGSLVVDVVAGTTYRIAVGGTDRQQDGTIRLRVAPNAQPDTLAPLVVIRSPASGFVSTTGIIDVEGTARDQDPSPSGVREVLVKVNENLAEVAEGAETWRRQKIRLRPGLNVIEVRAVDVSENLSEAVRVTVNYLVDVLPNDHFANASPLAGLAGDLRGNNGLASREFREPQHAGNQGGRSVWYSFTAPENGVLSLDTSGSDFDTVVAVYSGERLGALTALGSNDDATSGSGYSHLEQAIPAGTFVHIAIDGFAGQSGNFRLTYGFAAADLHRLNVSAGEGGGVDVASGIFPRGARVTLTATPDARHDFVAWTGTVNSFEPTLEVVLNSDVTVQATFQLKRYTDDFESGGLTYLPYTFQGANPWRINSEDAAFGKYSAQAGQTPDKGQSSLLLNARTRAGIGSFEYKVSSEEGWDYLEFYVDNVLVGRWSGEVPWTPYGFTVTEGNHTFEWRYSKDPGRSAGADTALIDNLLLPQVPAVDASSPAKLKIVSLKNDIAQLRIEGQVGQTYVTQTSSDLVRWRTIATSVNEKGFFFVTDSENSGSLPRFYRSYIP